MRIIYLLHARTRAVVFLSSDPRAASECQINGKKEERTVAERGSALVFRGFSLVLLIYWDSKKKKYSHCEE